MICTLPSCEADATLFLCEEHRFELADLLDNVDFLIVNLDPNIQATKATKKAGGQEGGNGTKSAGSRPPTIDTGQLRAWLWELPRNAYHEARDNPTAGQTLHMARIWVGNARTLVYGNNEEPPKPATIKQQRAKLAENCPEPLPPREAREYLAQHLGIGIAKKSFENWVQHRKLKYVLDHVDAEDAPRPRRLYWPAELLRTRQRMIGW